MKITACRFHISAARPQDFPRDRLPQIAFMGRSNVGKSSLLNRLLGRRDLARTSKAPGRTRAINFFTVNERVYFVDLPGFGYARVPAGMRDEWKDLVEAYVSEPGRPDLVLHLVDARHEPTEMDQELRLWLRHRGVPHAVALTKMDKLSRNEQGRTLERATRWVAEEVVATSAETGDGMPALWRIIDRACENATERAIRGDVLRPRAATQGGRSSL